MAEVSTVEGMDKWIDEFVIRRQQNPRVSPPPTNLKFRDSADYLKLKASSVLKKISGSLIRGDVDEGTLDQLETLEKHMLQQRLVITESHKSAYCWTAVECTLRFMWPLDHSYGLFTDAVERIWRKRIGVLKESGSGLVSDELLKWESDLKKAVEGSEIYQRIRESNVRYIAISCLAQLVKEHWALLLLGSSSIESNVEGDGVGSREVLNAVGDERTGRLESGNIELGSGEGEKHENGDNRDGEGVGCLEIDKEHASDEEETMGTQEQEHEPSLDKGDKMVARALKDYLLEIQLRIYTSTRQVQEPNNAMDHSVDVTPPPSRVHRSGASGQYHIEMRDNASEKSLSCQGTWSERVRPRLSNLLKKTNSPVRRTNKYWTSEEVEALREGVKECGKSWKAIKNANPAVFAQRTEVDLKDKWRNLLR